MLPTMNAYLAHSAAALLAGGNDGTMYSILQQVGATASLVASWDLGDAACWDGASQTITDRSGNGNHLFRGATSGAEASDPTVSGSFVAGGKSANEYLSFDGGDFLRLAVANPAGIEQMHKDGAKLCIQLYWRTAGSVGSNLAFCGDWGAVSHGFDWRFQAGATHEFRILASGGVSFTKSPTAGLAVSTNLGQAVSLDENAGAAGGFFWKNGAYDQVSGPADTWDPNYSAPSSSAASSTVELFALGGGTSPITNGARFYAGNIWSTNVSKALLDAIHAQFGPRLSI